MLHPSISTSSILLRCPVCWKRNSVLVVLMCVRVPGATCPLYVQRYGTAFTSEDDMPLVNPHCAKLPSLLLKTTSMFTKIPFYFIDGHILCFFNIKVSDLVLIFQPQFGILGSHSSRWSCTKGMRLLWYFLRAPCRVDPPYDGGSPHWGPGFNSPLVPLWYLESRHAWNPPMRVWHGY